jgi:hypothetical protein
MNSTRREFKLISVRLLCALCAPCKLTMALTAVFAFLEYRLRTGAHKLPESVLVF